MTSVLNFSSHATKATVSPIVTTSPTISNSITVTTKSPETEDIKVTYENDKTHTKQSEETSKERELSRKLFAISAVFQQADKPIILPLDTLEMMIVILCDVPPQNVHIRIKESSLFCSVEKSIESIEIYTSDKTLRDFKTYYPKAYTFLHSLGISLERFAD